MKGSGVLWLPVGITAVGISSPTRRFVRLSSLEGLDTTTQSGSWVEVKGFGGLF